MKSGSRANALLMELLIVILFFMFAATTLVQIFGLARQRSQKASDVASAVLEAQNVAEAMYAADDIDRLLEEQGFRSSHGAWSRDCGDYSLYVTGGPVPAGAGELWSGTVSAFYKLRDPDAVRAEDEELFSLTCTRYEGVTGQ